MARSGKYLGRNKIRGIAVYDSNIQLAIGNFDIIANNRSASIPGNKMIDGDTITPYVPGSQDTYYWPAEVIVDLKGLFALDRIEFWDAGGGGNFIINSGLDMFTMTNDLNTTLDQNQKRVYSFSAKQASFVSLTINQTQSEVQASPSKRQFPAEIKIFVKAISYNTIPAKTERPYRSYNELKGWNQDVFTPYALYNYPGAHKRIYDVPLKFRDTTPWPNTKYCFTNSYSQGFNYDTFFQDQITRGIFIIPCFPGTSNPQELFKPSWVSAGQGSQFTQFCRAHQYGADPTDPNSYIIDADMAFQWALRYGNNTSLSPSLAKIDTVRDTVAARVGTGLCPRLEWGNEEDNWFRSERESYMPDMQAAKMSAIYDGHCGTMGSYKGCKTADPNFQVIMPALADFSIDYIKRIYYWSKKNRTDGKFPSDVINVHLYTTRFGTYFGNDKGIHPEAYTRPGYTAVGVAELIDEFTDWIKRYLPGVEIWWTEFGYDTNPYSVVGVPLLTQAEALAAPYPLNSFQMQSAYVARSYFEAMTRTSVDKMTQFTLKNYSNCDELIQRYSDVNDNSQNSNWNNSGYGDDTLYDTSGDISIGQYGWIRGTTGSAINVATTTVGTTIVLTIPANRPDYDFAANPSIQLRDPADTAGNGAHLYTTYVSSTSTSLTVQVSATGPGGIIYSGTGSFSTWRLDTPYALKTGYYVHQNIRGTIGSLKFLRDDSTSEFRHIVVTNGTSREGHIIGLPTGTGNQITRTVNFGRSTTCKYRNLEDKTFTDQTFALSGSSGSVVINEMPKIFYFDY